MRVARSSETVAPYVPTPLADAGGPAEVRQPGSAPPSAPAAPPPLGRTASDSGTFAKLLNGLGRELDRGEAMADRAIHAGGAGARLSPDQLLALQAGIYRYSEAIDLVTKVVDRATQAVKTTLQSQ